MSRRLRAGELAEVRGAAEILATLDDQGRLDGLPFMPEMADLVGRRFRVRRRAGKTCVEGHGIRRMRDTLFLEDLRCDGSAHDGCQRDCLMFWKDAWLRPAAETPSPLADPLAERRALAALKALPTRGGELYVCQSTALAAATAPLPRWDLRPLLAELARRELSIATLAAMISRALVNRVRRLAGMRDLDVLAGQARRAPKGALGLKADEWVRIRSAEDIRQTLDEHSKNQGLTFEPEMTRHLGAVRQVDFPVGRIILEETGRMATLTSTVALRDLTCQGFCAKNCPRANPLYWREAWLERVPEQQAAE